MDDKGQTEQEPFNLRLFNKNQGNDNLKDKSFLPLLRVWLGTKKTDGVYFSLNVKAGLFHKIAWHQNMVETAQIN